MPVRRTSNLVRRRRPSINKKNNTALSTISWVSFVLATTSVSCHLRRLPVSSLQQHFPPSVHGFLVQHQHQQHSIHIQRRHQRRTFVFSTTLPVRMPRGVKKEHLPSKFCVICNRPFTWRKKWERCWDEVTTCSKSCNNQRRLQNKNSKKQHENDQQNDQQNQGQQQQQRRSMTTESTPLSGTMATVETITSARESTDPQNLDTSNHNDEQEFAELLSAIQLDAATENDDSGDSDSDGKASGGEIDSISEGSGGDIDGITSQHQEQQEQEDLDPIQQKKAERKAAKKRKKAERRAQREGRGDPSAGQKQCDMCSKSVNVLIRCMYEEGQTDWKMVCGSCWNVCSGGVVDGDKNHPHYRYGGLWKNRRRQQ